MNNINMIRSIAILSVVILHISSEFVSTYDIGTYDFFIGNLFNVSARWGVPVFIMLSGYLLLIKNEKPLIFFRKRLNKLLIPILFWSVFYILWSWLKLYLTNDEINFDIVSSILNGRPYYHMWFVYMIVSLYMITPILRYLINSVNLKGNIIVFSILMFVGFFDSVYNYKNYDSGNVDGLFVFWFVRYAGYYYLGGLINKYSLAYRFRTDRLILILFTLLMFNFILPYYYDYKYTYNNLSVNVIFLSVFIFLVFLNLKIKPHAERLFDQISYFSMGIYFLHPVYQDILRFLGRLGYPFGENAFNSMVYIPFISLIVFVLSYMTIYVFNKCYFLKKVI